MMMKALETISIKVEVNKEEFNVAMREMQESIKNAMDSVEELGKKVVEVGKLMGRCGLSMDDISEQIRVFDSMDGDSNVEQK